MYYLCRQTKYYKSKREISTDISTSSTSLIIEHNFYHLLPLQMFLCVSVWWLVYF